MTHYSKSSNKPKASQPQVEWEFDAIGTRWWIGIYEHVELAKLSLVKNEIQTLIDGFDKLYSRFRKDSIVTEMSEQAGFYKLPKRDKKFLDFYHFLYKATDGLVTPLIGQVISDAGYDSDYSFQTKELTRPSSLEESVAIHDATIEIKSPVLLDFGAAGKGYLVDLTAQLLEKMGIDKFCVDASGDMLARNTGPLRIGMENPDDQQKVIGVIELNNQAICGSSGIRRAWNGMHHIINPKELKAVRNVKAVWVVARDAMIADGLATALFFVGPERLAKYNFEYLLVTDQNHLQYSKGLKVELFR